MIKQFFSRLRFWIECSRWHSFGQSLIPALLTLLLVGGEDQFRLLPGLLAVIGAILAHTSANMLDDYFDFTSKSVEVRQNMVDGGMRARAHKCHYILSGETTPTRLLLVALFCGAVAAMIGGYLTYLRGWGIPLIAAIGAFFCFFYSAPPLRLSFHGMGELVIGLVFGPIMMCGVSYSAAGTIPSTVAFFSIPIGILVINIVYTHAILDLEPDRRAGKITLAVALGNHRRASWFLVAMTILAYLVPAWGLIRGLIPHSSVLVFLTIPLAIGLILSVRLFVRDPDGKVQRRFWMGPMERWELMCQAGIDWFMVRWYLSRNLLVAFCLMTALATIWERMVH